MNQATTNQTSRKNCSKCGATFECGMTSTSSDCWCFNEPHVGPIGAPDEDCMCPECLAEAIGRMSSNGNQQREAKISEPATQGPLIEGEDYYLEGTAMVFTAKFLLKRGYCCESGCRNCPY